MSVQLTIQTEETRPEVIDKMQRWALMGRFSHEELLRLQAVGQSIVSRTPIPDDVTKIAEYEALMKTIRPDRDKLISDRKETTSKLDAITSMFMTSEKSVDAHLINWNNALLKLKQDKKTADEKAKAHADELARVTEAIKNLISDKDSYYKKRIVEYAHNLYEVALSAFETEQQGLEFLELHKSSGMMCGDLVESYMWMRPTETTVLVTQDEVSKVWGELHVSINKPSYYQEIFKSVLTSKFEFFGIALQNKAVELERSKNELANQQNQIQSDKSNQQIANKLESTAVTHIETSAGSRALKTIWEVDLPVNDEKVALGICVAFITHIDKCRGGVRAAWDKLAVHQMASALAWYKNKDEKFEVTGIKFIQKDKL